MKAHSFIAKTDQDKIDEGYAVVGPNQPLVDVDFSAPVAQLGWVVIDVEAAGMCHSDVGIIDGYGVGWLSHYPIVLGHEVAGMVASLGDGVEGSAWVTGLRCA